jgi:hypothetical protein
MLSLHCDLGTRDCDPSWHSCGRALQLSWSVDRLALSAPQHDREEGDGWHVPLPSFCRSVDLSFGHSVFLALCPSVRPSGVQCTRPDSCDSPPTIGGRPTYICRLPSPLRPPSRFRTVPIFSTMATAKKRVVDGILDSDRLKVPLLAQSQHLARKSIGHDAEHINNAMLAALRAGLDKTLTPNEPG